MKSRMQFRVSTVLFLVQNGQFGGTQGGWDGLEQLPRLEQCQIKSETCRSYYVLGRELRIRHQNCCICVLVLSWKSPNTQESGGIADKAPLSPLPFAL